jgi:hypothetical protein
VSLIYSNEVTNIATINLEKFYISYQRAFPNIYMMTTVIFASPKVYYAGGYDVDFNTFKTTPQYVFDGGKF